MRKINNEIFSIILNEIKNNPFITEKEIADKTYYTERTIRRYFKILKDNKQIKLVKYKKIRYWEVL